LFCQIVGSPDKSALFCQIASRSKSALFCQDSRATLGALNPRGSLSQLCIEIVALFHLALFCQVAHRDVGSQLASALSPPCIEGVALFRLSSFSQLNDGPGGRGATAPRTRPSRALIMP